MARKVILIDASSSLYRAFFALPPLANSKGLPTGATLGFVTMLQKLLREERPDHVVVAWDGREATRRKRLYPEYKATRDAMPEDLISQLPYLRRAVDGFRLVSLEYEGEEADDVIATLVRRLEPEGFEIGIVSSDRDLLQLVGPRVVLLDTMRDRRLGPEEVRKRFGVPPERMLDYRALVGDSSDNIPGVRGIGEKGAARLISEYGSLDKLLAHAAEVTPRRVREALLAGAESARLSRELSRLRDDLPVDFSLEASRVGEPDREALCALFEELELRRLLDTLGDGASASRPAPRSAVETERILTPHALDALRERLASAERTALAVLIDPEEPMRGELLGLSFALEPTGAAHVEVAPLGVECVLETLGPLLRRGDRIWVGFDLKRDAVALGRRGVPLGGELRDVAVAAYVVDPGAQVRRPELLTRSYLERELPTWAELAGAGARRRPLTELDPERVAGLCGCHVAAALELDGALEKRLAETGQLDLYRSMEVPLVGVLARMERVGVRIDEGKLAELSRDLARELERLERRIHELAGELFNIGSPKQLQHILFEKLALTPTRRTKTGFSTDEAVLEELAHDHPLPAEILRHRRLAKLKSTYVDALPPLVHSETGRIHARFNQTVAATGRLSASNPNLQNIPIRTPEGQRIREAFVPAEGRLLLSADYSQIELRLLAHLSQDAPLLDAFRRGQDIHARTAAEVFGVPLEEVSEEQRARMKGIGFGILYGSSAFGIARQLGISQAEAQHHIDAYFERYPGVRGFLERIVAEARACGYAETLDGRRRYLPDLRSRNRARRAAAERMAPNAVLQGTAADIIKRAMVRIDTALRAPGAPEACMILTVHDELVFELLPEHREALETLVVGHMQGVMQLSVPLRVNLSWGRNWREAH
ncbi:MAG: DNA polymerase I [Myxococcota bacterium]